MDDVNFAALRAKLAGYINNQNAPAQAQASSTVGVNEEKLKDMIRQVLEEKEKKEKEQAAAQTLDEAKLRDVLRQVLDEKKAPAPAPDPNSKLLLRMMDVLESNTVVRQPELPKPNKPKPKPKKPQQNKPQQHKLPEEKGKPGNSQQDVDELVQMIGQVMQARSLNEETQKPDKVYEKKTALSKKNREPAGPFAFETSGDLKKPQGNVLNNQLWSGPPGNHVNNPPRGYVKNVNRGGHQQAGHNQDPNSYTGNYYQENPPPLLAQPSAYQGGANYRGQRGHYQGRGGPQGGHYQEQGDGYQGGPDGQFQPRGGPRGNYRGRGGPNQTHGGPPYQDGHYQEQGGHEAHFQPRGGPRGNYRGRGGPNQPHGGPPYQDGHYQEQGGHEAHFQPRGGPRGNYRGRGGPNQPHGGPPYHDVNNQDYDATYQPEAGYYQGHGPPRGGGGPNHPRGGFKSQDQARGGPHPSQRGRGGARPKQKKEQNEPFVNVEKEFESESEDDDGGKQQNRSKSRNRNRNRGNNRGNRRGGGGNQQADIDPGENPEYNISTAQDQPPPKVFDDPIYKVQAIQSEIPGLKAVVEKYSGNSRKDKSYVFIDEMLMRNLLKLDDIETEGRDDIRQAKKAAIRGIQDCIHKLEAKVPLIPL